MSQPPEIEMGTVPIRTSADIKRGLLEMTIGLGKKEPIVEGAIEDMKRSIPN